MYAITCRMFRVTMGSNNNGETKRVGKEDDDEDEENEGEKNMILENSFRKTSP